MGLKSANTLEHQAAISSLSTLMSISLGETYSEFEKHLKDFLDCYSHDMLSESDIWIFHTPEGMLSSEQGVYVAESVASKNMKEAKGRYRAYEHDDDEDHSIFNNSVKREAASRKNTAKSTKKPDKGKTAKEEARELLLTEEASVHEKVSEIKKNLCLILRALEVANPIFAHSQQRSLVKFVDPLLRSPLVRDVAYETMVKL